MTASLQPITGRSGEPSNTIFQSATLQNSVSHDSPNVVLIYSHRGTGYQATLRCTKLSINYGLNAEQSHSRQVDAFYPHRRNQGTFALTFACVGWQEYNQTMGWFTRFARQSLSMAKNDPAIYIAVALPSRDFYRWGIPTTGIGFGDHTASMVFNPTIVFVSVNDSTDPHGGVLQSKNASTVDMKGVPDLAAAFFYPSSKVNEPGKLDEGLYGPTGKVALGATVAQEIIAGGGHPTNVGQSYQEA